MVIASTDDYRSWIVTWAIIPRRIDGIRAIDRNDANILLHGEAHSVRERGIDCASRRQLVIQLVIANRPTRGRPNRAIMRSLIISLLGQNPLHR